MILPSIILSLLDKGHWGFQGAVMEGKDVSLSFLALCSAAITTSQGWNLFSGMLYAIVEVGKKQRWRCQDPSPQILGGITWAAAWPGCKGMKGMMPAGAWQVRQQPISSPFPLHSPQEERPRTEQHPALEEAMQETESTGTAGTGSVSQYWTKPKQEGQDKVHDWYCRYINNINGK